MSASRRRPIQLERLETRDVPATLLTPGVPPGTAANGPSDQILAVSDDGNRVLFVSRANNLVVGVTDNNAQPDLFWRDIPSGTTKLITGTPAGVALGFDNTTPGNAVMNADGLFVAFVSKTATSLFTGNATQQDQPATPDVFRWNAITGSVELVSAQNIGNGNQTAIGFLSPAVAPNISADGSLVSFLTPLQNNFVTNTPLNDSQGTFDLFVRDMRNSNVGGSATVPVSRSSSLSAAMVGLVGDVQVQSPGVYMSRDGTVFVYSTKVDAAAIVPGATDAPGSQTSDVFVRDLTRAVNDSTRLVSLSANSSTRAVGAVSGQNASGAIVSGDGKAVLFLSDVPGGADINQIVTDYQANGAPNALYARTDPFGASVVRLVSARDGTLNQSGSNFGVSPGDYRVTTDGSLALFNSQAPDLVAPSIDVNGTAQDAFLRDLTGASARTELVSAGSKGQSGATGSTATSISNDGRFVAFQSSAGNLVPGLSDRNNVDDVFVRDRLAGNTRAASVRPGAGLTGDGPSQGAVLAGNGSRVVFTSLASNISAEATGGVANVFTSGLPLPSPLGVSKQVGISGGPDGSVQIGTFEGDSQLRIVNSLKPLPTFFGDVRNALADVNGDGIVDVIGGVGPGGGSLLSVLSGENNTPIVTPGAVYEPGFRGGIFVAAADLDGDGKAEVIVSPDQGGGGRIVVLKFQNGAFVRVADFFGIEDPDFRGGARVSAGDVNGDGTPDVIVSAGFGGGPRIAIFDGKSLLSAAPGATPQKVVEDFFAFEPQLRNGAYVGAGDFNADGRTDLVFGGGPGGGPRVLILDGTRVMTGVQDAITNPLANFFAGDVNDRGGVRVVAKDIDGDGFADLVTGSGENVPGQVRTYRGATFPQGGQGEPPLEQSLSILPELGILINGVFVG